MYLFTLLATFFALLGLTVADVEITKPATGESFSASGGSAKVSIQWKDTSDSKDDADSLSKVQSYAIVLCTGPNSDISAVKALEKKLKAGSTSYEATIDANIGPNGQYFIQVYAVYPDNGHSIYYTNRFKLTDMKGEADTYTFPASYFSISGDQPLPQPYAAAQPTSINSKSFSVTYTLQTGKTKFAPMQTQPGSTVTATTYSRRHPTSAYTPYKSYSPSPNALSTITPGWDYTVVSKVNSASVAGYPTEFYPASSRVKQATLSAQKRRRWLE